MATRDIHYWTFQANPTEYRVEDVVRIFERDTWKVEKSDVRKGDLAIIWKSQGTPRQNRGIVAFAEVLSNPYERPTAHPDYYVDSHEALVPVRRAEIKYVCPPHLPLWIGGQADKLISQLTVNGSGKGCQGTVFHVTPQQWQAIVEAAGGWPRHS